MALTKEQIREMFSVINTAGIPAPYPARWALSTCINSHRFIHNRCPADMSSRALFFTASLDLWQRGIHSLLLSMSLTKKSPLWSSASGYYASHYVVRSFANLFGYCVADLGQIDTIKDGADWFFRIVDDKPKEHSQYWSAAANKIGTPFVRNTARGEVGDKIHRTWASYADHLPEYASYGVTPDYDLRQRCEELSHIHPAVPSIRAFPDLDHVQAIALARIVKYRDFADEVFGTESGTWSQMRQPAWCPFDLGIEFVSPETRDYIR